MTDEELITWLRKYSSTNAADRIEALRAALDEVEARANDYYERWNDCQDKRMKAEAEIARLNDHIEGVALDTHKIVVGLVKERDAANALLRRFAAICTDKTSGNWTGMQFIEVSDLVEAYAAARAHLGVNS